MTNEKKIIFGIIGLTVAIIVSAVFFISGDPKTTLPKEEIVATSGLHWHPKLEIYIDGKKQDIPANVGLTGQVHQKIHTHDEDAKDGVVHMEMQGVVTKDDTKLGNFLRIWGKEFSSTQIFDKKNDGEKKVVMIVNGKENNEYENYLMKDGDKIEIRFE